MLKVSISGQGTALMDPTDSISKRLGFKNSFKALKLMIGQDPLELIGDHEDPAEETRAHRRWDRL